jgi:hypothetical protein
VGLGLLAGSASAQVTPAAGYTPPDDTPSIRLGATLYADYTYTNEPQTLDADGNTINFSAFSVTRSYINVTGNISHLIAFRFTPDISRETNTASALNGSLVFRVKYAFMQFNLDEWVGRGSWARLGIQQTPWVDFEESIYRYRFQGTVFTEREGFLSSSDAGASFRYNVPSNYGEVHVGVYNGENYNRVEVNDQKAVRVRGSVRPFARSATLPLRGFRANVFLDADHYVKDAPRRRVLGALTFEHPYVNAEWSYLSATDRTSARLPDVDAKGYSVWATPQSPQGWGGLLRYDHLTPNDARNGETRSRRILGVSYWFPHQGNVSAALLLDYDEQMFHGFAQTPPKQKRVGVHAQLNF